MSIIILFFMSILVTGGAGYIGSHTVFELLEAKKQVVIVDNLSNSTVENIQNIENHFGIKIPFYNIDLCDIIKLEYVFKKHNIVSVIHFAGFKSVSESISDPLKYYTNNIGTTLNLLNCVEKYNVKQFIFSSSATVYDHSTDIIPETHSLSPVNPYGHSKLFVEQILQDFSKSLDIDIIILRYFNPIGAHPLGFIKENPIGPPNNLIPFVLKVINGEYTHLNIYGNDYDTIDGTGIRDYIHVQDLALGHLAALEKKQTFGIHIYNLGTGIGHSVLQIIHEIEQAFDTIVPWNFTKRRHGDQPIVVADPTRANVELNWKATKTITDACRDLL
jgi:UDP-glucose 4-epimerase